VNTAREDTPNKTYAKTYAELWADAINENVRLVPPDSP
jgi:hypothetical protein